MLGGHGGRASPALRRCQGCSPQRARGSVEGWEHRSLLRSIAVPSGWWQEEQRLLWVWITWAEECQPGLPSESSLWMSSFVIFPAQIFWLGFGKVPSTSLVERGGKRFETLTTKKRKRAKLSLEISDFCSPPGLRVLNARYCELGKQTCTWQFICKYQAFEHPQKEATEKWFSYMKGGGWEPLIGLFKLQSLFF